jgi:hypothetical protein
MLSARIGFFLLKDRWDLALSETFGVFTSQANESGNFNEELGLLSKVYFPIKIKKYKFSPYTGAGVSLVVDGDFDEQDTYFRTMFLAGVSYYVGPGSLDIGMQYDKTSKFTMTVGYTFLF